MTKCISRNIGPQLPACLIVKRLTMARNHLAMANHRMRRRQMMRQLSRGDARRIGVKHQVCIRPSREVTLGMQAEHASGTTAGEDGDLLQGHFPIDRLE